MDVHQPSSGSTPGAVGRTLADNQNPGVSEQYSVLPGPPSADNQILVGAHGASQQQYDAPPGAGGPNIDLLERLRASDSALTELEWGECRQLIQDDALAFFSALRDNFTVRTLELGNINIGKEGAAALAEALKKQNSTLTSLNLSNSNIGKEGVGALAEALKVNNTLTSLDLNGNKIGKEGAAALAEALKKNSTLTALNLAFNDIGKEGAIALAKALKKNGVLTALNLDTNKIGKEGAGALAEELKENSSLANLALRWNNIGNDGASVLAHMLTENKSLTTLYLNGSKIGNEGAALMADALKENDTLTELHFDSNEIGNEGAVALADALKENDTLTELYLRSNKINKEGAVALAESLKENSTLATLHLDSNEIGKDGSAAFPEALKENKTLATLHLAQNFMGDKCAAALVLALKENKALATLYLSRNYKIGDECAAALADALKENDTLTFLDLSGCNIGEEGAVALADALKVNNTLVTLDLGSNNFGNKGAAALTEALRVNKAITSLDITNIQVEAAYQAWANDLLWRNKVFLEHKLAMETYGARFYVTKAPPVVEDGIILFTWSIARCGNGPSTSLFTPVWEAAIAGGVVLKLVHRALSELLRQSTNFKPALKHLIDNTRNAKGSPLLHAIAGLNCEESFDMCKFLIDKIGADFDTVIGKSSRTARDIALGNPNPYINQWARSVGTILGRYYIDGGLSAPPVHKSATCTVHFAVDVTKGKDDPKRNVALKIINELDQMERELKTRLLEIPGESDEITEDLNRFEDKHAVPLLRYHKPPEHPELCCLVMPMGKRNLHQIIDSERIHLDLDKIYAYGKDIAQALDHLHSQHDIVHGDFKPRNVVRIDGDMKLIDFDASVEIDDELTDKCSTAYIPPELARRIDELKREPNNAESATADISMDVWAFGVTIYCLCTGKTLFSCDLDDNIDEERDNLRLMNWNGLVSKERNKILRGCGDPAAANAFRNFLAKCLHKDPEERFPDMKAVLEHDAFKKSYGSTQDLELHRKIDAQSQKLDKQKKKLEEIDEKLDTAVRVLLELQTRLGVVLKMTRKILSESVAPKLFCIVPLGPSVEDWVNLNMLVSKKVKIVFVCPVTLSLPRDDEGKSMGYETTLPTDWVVKYGPALKISLEVLQIAFAAGRLAGFPLPNISSVGKSTNLFSLMNNNLIDYMGEDASPTDVIESGAANGSPSEPGKAAPDLKELGDVISNRLTMSVPEGGSGLPTKMEQMIAASYGEVKLIAEKAQDPIFLKTGLVRAVGCDGSAEYVLNDPKIKALYENNGQDCIGLNPTELSDIGADLQAVVKEGKLEKQSGGKRYFVLRKNGFLNYYNSKEEREDDPLGVKGKTKPARVKRTEKHGSHECWFQIEYADGSKHMLRASNSGEKDIWMAAVKNLLSSRENSVNVVT